MKLFHNYLLILTLLASLFSACRKDKVTEDEVIITPEPTVLVETGVRGLVTDESGAPLENATVTLGTAETQTNADGYFSLTGLAKSTQGFVRVEKPGYFPSLASFSVKAGDYGRVIVTLRAKILAAQFSGNIGGTATVPGGGKVVFGDHSFLDANGSPYTGTVYVYATNLDPSNPLTNSMVPGSFLGRSANGERQILQSFGMMHVLLETPSGQKLQLGKPATIEVAVPADRLSSAPANIPLWYIDEATSLWKEQGVATLSGSVYTGQVSHFSWWNCDIGSGNVWLSGTIRLGSDHPYVVVRATQANGATATTTPSASGFFKGGVPANQIILIEVINECGTVVYSANVGPFNSDADLGTISLDWTTDWVQVSGNLVDCDQNPVTSGYVDINSNNPGIVNFPITVDPATGNFSGTIAGCGSTEVSLIAYDLNALLASDEITLPANPTVDFGEVSVCDAQITSGILLEFNGTQKLIMPALCTGFSADSASYGISAIDDQGLNNKAQYDISIIDWNSGQLPHFWAMSTNFTLTGSPVYYQINSQGATFEPISLGTQPGEYLIFKVTNVTLIEVPSNISYPGSTVTITAQIQ